MGKEITIGWHIKEDDGIFEFNHAPLSLEETFKELGFEIVDKKIYYDDTYNVQYCTIQVRFDTTDELRTLLDILVSLIEKSQKTTKKSEV